MKDLFECVNAHWARQVMTSPSLQMLVHMHLVQKFGASATGVCLKPAHSGPCNSNKLLHLNTSRLSTLLDTCATPISTHANLTGRVKTCSDAL
jgi:hypothetical protein